MLFIQETSVSFNLSLTQIQMHLIYNQQIYFSLFLVAITLFAMEILALQKNTRKQQYQNVNKEFIQQISTLTQMYTHTYNGKVDILQVYISIYKTETKQQKREKVNAIYTYAVATNVNSNIRNR